MKLYLFLEKNRSWSIPAGKTSFDAYKFRSNELDHRTKLEFYKLKPVGKIFSHHYGKKPTSEKENFLDEILSPSEYTFFVQINDDKSHEGVGGIKRCFSVHTEEAKKTAIQMGYREIKVYHLTDTNQIPALENISEPQFSDTGEELILPRNKKLKIYKSHSKEKIAVSIVRAFEEHYIYKNDNDAIEKASPCLKWTNELRHKHKLMYDNHPFYQWCCTYYAVKFLNEGMKPEEIMTNSSDLRRLSVQKANKPKDVNWYEHVINQLNESKDTSAQPSNV